MLLAIVSEQCLPLGRARSILKAGFKQSLIFTSLWAWVRRKICGLQVLFAAGRLACS